MGFVDMRQWIALLEKRVSCGKSPPRSIGTARSGPLPGRPEKKGPALLFESIKGYGNGRCTKLFVNGLGTRSRLALALGFPREVTNRELVQYAMKKNRETIAPVIVRRGRSRTLSSAARPSIRRSSLYPDGTTSKADATSTRSPAS